MAVASIWSVLSGKSHGYPPTERITERIKQVERNRIEYSLAFKNYTRLTNMRWNSLQHKSKSYSKAKRSQIIFLTSNGFSPIKRTIQIHLSDVCNAECYETIVSRGPHQRDKAYYASDHLETGICKRQLNVLDFYFDKLNSDQPVGSPGIGSDANDCRIEESSQVKVQQTEITDIARNLCRRKRTLDSLENYFGELKTGQNSRMGTSTSLGKENLEGHSIRKDDSAVGGYSEETMVTVPSSFERVHDLDDESGRVLMANGNIRDLQIDDDEASDFYLINLLVAINIAVFLFEIASPIRNSEVEHLSLPLMYGAKINKLILVGEWWRLLTPMFLHTGLLHVALSCWVLMTFGPQVRKEYGPFTFLLIYVLGGICGNMTSFIHTPELTVSGTGPVFAIIGAWLVYNMQNKQVDSKELSERMFWKAVTATALSFVLSNFGGIDDWTHLGAAFSGVIFGYLTCPTLQLSKDGQKHASALLVHRQADPCKSLLVFAVSIVIMSSFVFLYGTQLELLEMEDFF